MAWREAFRALIGGALVYVAMAACSASDGAQNAAGPMGQGGSADAATGGYGGAEGGFEAGLEGAVDALVDALLDPVPDANADDAGPCVCSPPAPDIAVENCDKTLNTNGGGTVLYAVHAYPGKTAAELSRVTVSAKLSYLGSSSAPKGYGYVGSVAYVADGSVAVVCGAPGSSQFDSVTFVLP